MRDKGETNHAMLKMISLARKVNEVCGFAALAPWDADGLNEEWQAVFEGLYDIREVKLMQERQARASEDAFAKVRARHPSYRKYG